MFLNFKKIIFDSKYILQNTYKREIFNIILYIKKNRL